MSLEYWLKKISAYNPETKIDLSLSRIKKALAALDISKFDAITIKVAGTNGKGSTIAALNQIYFNANYKVACYTSPHILNFNERLKFNNKYVADSAWCEEFTNIYNIITRYDLTYFESITLVAFSLISKGDFDIILLEIGLGGRFDAVNSIQSDVGIITSIGLDHVDKLGNTTGEIAYEKAGIIEPNKKVIFSGDKELECIKNIAKANNCTSYAINSEFSWQITKDRYLYHENNRLILNLPVPNIHPDIAAAVLKTIFCLNDDLPVANKTLDIISDIKQVGRCQVIKARVPMVIDVSHNVPAVCYLVKFIKNNFPNKNVKFIFGCLATKDYRGILSVAESLNPIWYFAALQADKSVNVNNFIVGDRSRSKFFKTISKALDCALNEATDNDIIVAFGSFYVVAEVIQTLTKDKKIGTINI